MIRRLCICTIFAFQLSGCGKYYVRENQKLEHSPVKPATEQRRLKDSIQRYKVKVDAETSRIIAVSAGELTRDGEETSIGNFVCDAMDFASEKYFGKSEIVLANRGGLRANLPKGDIRVIHMFELMPFENEMVQVTLEGKDLKKILPLIAAKKHAFKGMNVKIKGEQVISATVGGEEISEQKKYTLLTSDYLYNGGDGFDFLRAGEMKDSGKKIRDALIGYCEFKKVIDPYRDGRLEVSK